MAAAPKTWTPKRVRSEEERGGGSSEYITLNEQYPRFSGYPLFDGDPKMDEPGYYEYLEHWHNASQRRVPCAGDDCPLCEEGDKPKVRAKSLWLVTKDEKGNDLTSAESGLGGELRIFSLNWNVIKVLTEMRAEGDKIKGRLFRVSRLDDRGNYSLMAKDDKLTATQVKEALKSKDAPDFEGLITAQLRRAMEGLAVARALDAGDEETPAEPASSSKGAKGAKDKPAKEEEGWPETAEDLVVTVSEVDGANFILVDHDDYGEGEKVWGTSDLDLTDIEEGATIEFTYYTDDEDDKVATAFEVQEAEEPAAPAEESEGGVNDLPAVIDGEEFEVNGEVDEQNGTIPVISEELGLEFPLFVLDGVKIDWDDYPVGAKVTISAEKDTVGDMVASEAPTLVKAKKTAAAKGGAKKTAAAKKGAKK